MMNSKVDKDFEDFIFSGREILVVEKALFSLLDKYKDQLIRGRLSMDKDTKDVITQCLETLKLHDNFTRNKKYFNVTLKKYDEYITDDSNADTDSGRVA